MNSSITYEGKGKFKITEINTWLDLSEDNLYSQFLITVMAGVNQLERDLIHMRQREGIELAKKEGKFKSRLRSIIKIIIGKELCSKAV